MRIPLLGQSYQPLSLAASAQDCINLFFEPTEDPNEKAKGIGALYGTPGRTSIGTNANLGGEIRGVWSGAGRVFVMGALKFCEFTSAGVFVTSYAMPGGFVNGHMPVGIFSNGTQFMLVTSDEVAGNPHGFAYFLNAGVVTKCVFDSYVGTVNVPVGGGAGVPFLVNWVSGDLFLSDGTWDGSTVVIAGVPAPCTVLAGSVDINGTFMFCTSVGVTGVLTGAAYTHAAGDVTAITGAYLDGYFIVQRPPTAGANLGQQINISRYLCLDADGVAGSGQKWDGLDYARKESSIDNLQCIYTHNEQLFLKGTNTLEIWQASGGVTQTGLAGFPFQRINGATANYGTVSRWADASINNLMFSIGSDFNGGIVAYMFDGLTPTRISTFAEESAWENTEMRHSIGFCERHGGHTFYVINTGAVTWVYDATAKAWHQRYRYSGGAFAPYGTCFHTFVQEGNSQLGIHITAGPHYQLATYDANLYKESLYIYSDNGTDMKRQRTLPYQYDAANVDFFGRMDLEMETGTVPSGAAPNVNRSYSADRGRTFSTEEPASIGVHDDSGLTVAWLAGGSGSKRIWRFTVIGQFKVALIDCQVDTSAGLGRIG
jgi:hypothetical protein